MGRKQLAAEVDRLEARLNTTEKQAERWFTRLLAAAQKCRKLRQQVRRDRRRAEAARLALRESWRRTAPPADGTPSA